MKGNNVGLKIYETNSFHQKRDEDKLPEEDEKGCRRLLPLTSDSLEMLRILVLKEDRRGEEYIGR